MADFYRANLNVEEAGRGSAFSSKTLDEKIPVGGGAKIAAQIAGPFFITTQGSQ